MSTRIFVRALHSTRSVLNAGSAAPKAPAPKTAAQLGFSGERRKRELPSLDKPARPAGEVCICICRWLYKAIC
jgi:hypothetical protein